METPDEFESIETAQVLNDLNKSRVTHPDDRSENAGDFHDSKPGNGTAMHQRWPTTINSRTAR